MKKFKGSGFLAIVILTAVVTSLIAFSSSKISSYTFNSLLSSKISVQAKQYAVSKMDLLRSNGYSNLVAQSQSKIGDTEYSDVVILGNESNYSSTVKQRPVTVDVYYATEKLPRFSLSSLIYSKSVTSDAGCQIVTGTDSVSFIANGSYKSMTIIVASKFTPKDGTWTGTATCTGYINGSSVGTVVTNTTTSKGGSKGHYWGTTEAVTNMTTFSNTISSGNTIQASITSSSRHSGSTITVILGT